MKIFHFAIGLLLSTALSPTLNSFASNQRLSLSGSSTLAPLVSELGKRFESSNAGVRVDVQTGGSSRGIADVRRGVVSIGMSSRTLHPEEKSNLQIHTVAMDGVAFIVHKDNPVSNLSRQDLLEIYTKKKTRWSDFGGNDEQIVVVDRARGRSEVELITDYLELAKKDLKGDLIAGENQQCVKIISGNPNAIVYLSVGTAAFMVSQGTPLKPLDLDGIPATTKNVALGTFPIVRPLLFITKKDENSLRDAFVSFASSEDIHELIKAHAFVPIHN